MSTAAPAAAPPGTALRWAVTRPVPVLAGAGLLVVAVGVAGLLVGGRPPSPVPPGLTATVAAAFAPLGVFLLRRLPGNPLGALMSLVGASAAAAAMAACWSSLPSAAWLAQWLWLPPLAAIPLLLLLAPEGRLPSRRVRPLVVVLVAGAAVATAGLAGAALVRPDLVSAPVAAPLPEPARRLALLGLGGLAVVVLATLGVLGVLVVRWHRADPLVRRRLACLLPAGVLLAAGVVLDGLNVLPYAWVAGLAALPLGLTVAVLRYRLHDLDLFIHRGAVWLVLTALGVGVFAVVATAAGALLVPPGSPVASLLAAATVAALLQPLQRFTQRGVGRMLYGRRDEPYAVLTELGGHLTALRDPLAVLPQIADTIVASLRVPYAAVRVAGEDGSVSTAAETGRRAGPPQRFPMVAHGRAMGELLVAPRRPDARFSAAESRLLHDLAGQAALAAEACRYTIELRRARDRLVLAREEERRRLRRDLHDGVAAALVGSRMLAEAARRAVPADGPAPRLLDELGTDLATCTAEVRTLIDGLRPPSLDDGLAAGLAQLVARVPAPTAVSLHVEGALAELPAAVEVAAYRVVAEALANVVKHAGAATCAVTVRADGAWLEVEVRDDGAGFTERAGGPGVGLGSIRGRVEELTGRCTITSAPGGGTVVTARLPLPATGAADADRPGA